MANIKAPGKQCNRTAHFAGDPGWHAPESSDVLSSRFPNLDREFLLQPSSSSELRCTASAWAKVIGLEGCHYGRGKVSASIQGNRYFELRSVPHGSAGIDLLGSARSQSMRGVRAGRDLEQDPPRSVRLVTAGARAECLTCRNNNLIAGAADALESCPDKLFS